MVAFFRRGRGTNATARIRNASRCCIAGRRPNVNAAGGGKRNTARPMPRPSVSDGAVDGSRAKLRPVRASLLPQPLPKSRSRRAWSRSDNIPEDFCDRPGCYEPLPGTRRGPAQYCGGECRQAQRRVHDRERKFKDRQRKAANAAASARRPKPLRPTLGGRRAADPRGASVVRPRVEAASATRPQLSAARGWSTIFSRPNGTSGDS